MRRRTDSLKALARELDAFAAARDWAQFHNPKNLAMALAAETGEVLEHFRWLTPEQAASLERETRDEVALECADVLLFLVRLADTLGVDLAAAARRKMAINAKRYPVRKSRGSARKWNRL